MVHPAEVEQTSSFEAAAVWPRNRAMQLAPKKREERSIFEHAVARGTKRVTGLTPRELTFSKHAAISCPAIDDDLAAHDE